MSYAETARDKRNSWMQGNGTYSMRGELWHGISMRERVLNRKVMRASRLNLKPVFSTHNRDWIRFIILSGGEWHQGQFVPLLRTITGREKY